ncbi:nucleotide exchange factor GrpE [Priestia koreensis]|nr:nucleotide exchange factor GrpE [Priestia koreensis]
MAIYLREVKPLANEKHTSEEMVEESVHTEEVEETDVHEEAAEQAEEKDAKDVEIEALQAKVEEQENRYLRLQADFDNLRRRTRLDAESAEKYRAQKLITDILPALDNFERALKVDTEEAQNDAILQGMQMVYRQLAEALQKEGLEAIEAVGSPFDPYLHQAVMQVEDDSYEPNTVVEEFQKGYKLKDKVIRPSMVKVNQ